MDKRYENPLLIKRCLNGHWDERQSGFNGLISTVEASSIKFISLPLHLHG